MKGLVQVYVIGTKFKIFSIQDQSMLVCKKNKGLTHAVMIADWISYC